MLEIIKDFLLNLFFILLPIFVITLWIEEKNVSEKIKRHILTASAAIAIIFCITFPVSFDKEYMFDLRQIPFWLGGLYGGPLASIFLCMITIGYRSLFGGKGLIVTIISAVFQTLICLLLSKKFITLSSKQKILLSFVLSAFSGMLMIIMVRLLYDVSDFFWTMWLVYLPIQPLSMLLTCYLREALQANIEVRKRIIRAEKMEVVSHLAASISHEVRNPLTASRGFMQLLEQHHLPLEKRKEYIRIAVEELDRAEAIITDYLTFAKPAPECVEKLNIKTEIERVIDILRPLANMSSVEIQTSLIPLHVKGERDKFQQCLLNIIKNAIEAMPNGGLLDIYVSLDKNNVLIRISDTGVGMTGEQIERLGEPYFTTKGTKGTGLGMMVVYRIIESMNGTIKITSEVNKGTQVCVYLPLIQSLPRTSSSTRKEKILAY
ncbi:two-component system sporulation sensor kinase B [Anoxybacillus vitaminiphilus]|uniref:histidine kinase n=1 Tax=Paranoxybacillus vitaminiphilus TaxID=581036 RepID=A0A327YKY7_9BACL|nr:ATP-binding protein [Anoxybacillus vitaminiphilus]RAK18929.1 two-component system sporulation sensor kinase B [Anoxybacillus vitaminiphilus]